MFAQASAATIKVFLVKEPRTGAYELLDQKNDREATAGGGQCVAGAGVRLLDVQYGDVDAERAAFARAHPGLLARFEDLDAYADLEGVAAASSPTGLSSSTR